MPLHLGALSSNETISNYGGPSSDSASAGIGFHLRTFSLSDWGYTVEDTGVVSSLQWSADGSACAVG